MEVREDILRILEIPKVLAEFASCVRGELGLSALGRLRPRGDVKALEERVALLKSCMSCGDSFGEWPWNSSAAFPACSLKRGSPACLQEKNSLPWPAFSPWRR